MYRQLPRLTVLALTLTMPLTAAMAAGPAAMHGFTAESAAIETALEARFDAGLKASEMKDWLERMASEPNHVSSIHDKANAEFMLAEFKKWGWDARIETFEVLYPKPKQELLELVGPTHLRASLQEPALAQDRASQNTRAALPPYNAYGADGDVTGEVVYANYGMPDDYKDLARRGISVKGRIVLTRYGGGWRGLKPKLAYEHGAIGCLIYSDPKDDGYVVADAYPAGAGRPALSLQRGSVADMPIYTGDPLTPGVGSTKDAKRLAIADAKTILKIPVIPISYTDAKPFLAALKGPVAPANWRGGLPMTYHIGPGPAKAHLVIHSDWSQQTIYDVIATLRGSEFPDEWVLRGNHHDGWVFGASDPLSGNVAMMGEMKAIGQLAASGWKPKRTLVYSSWDGEEVGLVGSTEWVETHMEDLAKHAVAYINSDGNSHGFFGAGGSPSLQQLVDEVAAGVIDPTMHATVLERSRARAIITAGHSDESRRVAQSLLKGGDLPLEPLGSGSDFTPFLQHAGVASLNLGFGNDDPSGVYHSIYDSYDHYIRFEDPDLNYGVALAEVAGHAVLRLADADLLPFHEQELASNVSRYIEELEKLTDKMRADTLDTNHIIEQKLYELGADSADPVGPPPHDDQVPFLSFAPLKNAATALTASATEFDAAYTAALNGKGPTLAKSALIAVNSQLRAAEPALLAAEGLPGRDWYKHMIVAPGLHTGYGAKTLPGVREAIEERRWSEAADYILIIARTLDSHRAVIDSANKLLR